MEKSIETLKTLLKKSLPRCELEVDAPEQQHGNWWLDVRAGRKRIALEYRPERGFGIFAENAGYGEGPSEIYRTPELTSKRLAQLLIPGKRIKLTLKDIRELYGHSQVKLAKKIGIKQSAISRFEKREHVKLNTLAAAIKALGGELELRARFSDSDVPLSLAKSK
jgi:DNA-binding XRE family transcriptional regulator